MKNPKNKIMAGGIGIISDKDSTLSRNKDLLKRSSYFENSKPLPDEKKITKTPSHIKNQIHKENKRGDIIRAIVVIFFLIAMVSFVFLLFNG